MYVGLDIANPGPELPCCFVLLAELPGGSLKLFMHEHDITLPSGFSYSNLCFQTFVIPNIPLGTYTWHVALLSPTTHDIIVEDKVEWEFIWFDDFENEIIGEVPAGWNKIGGTLEDTIQVSDDHSYLGIKSLKLHEHGGDSENCRVESDRFDGCSSLIFGTWFRIKGSYEDRAAIKLKDENRQSTVSINCIIDRYWGYLSEDGWLKIDGSPKPRINTWYHVKIVADGDLDRFKVIIDDFESDWLIGVSTWVTLNYIEFRGNSNYPSDSWYDNVVIVNYDNVLASLK
jgi:hypothetical protein